MENNMSGRQTKLAAKLYISDSDIDSGKGLSKRELSIIIDRARCLSLDLQGIVELHIIMCGGSHNKYIDAYDTVSGGIFDKGKQICQGDYETND